MTEVSGTMSWMEHLPLSLLEQKGAEYWVWVTISKINEYNCSYWSKSSYLLEQISRAPRTCHAVNKWVVFYFIAIRINKRVFIFYLAGMEVSLYSPVDFLGLNHIVDFPTSPLDILLTVR